MKKIYLENLNESELMELVKNNNDLREMLENEFIEAEMDYISDVLHTLKLKNWSIGFYNNNFIEMYDDEEQLDNIRRATRDFGLLSDESIEKVDFCTELMHRLIDMEWENKQYENLENKIDNLLYEIEDLVLDSLNMMTDDRNITDDVLLDRLECMLDWHEEEYYIYLDDKEKYNVYKDIKRVFS